ncbi:twin-arginine translocation signal domain-containing protein [Pararhodobacter sp.]|uniref:twin-arginine translocation signal domain-containing protein n=1 Tax=Pararhodobacter sp. TaxID=2127056 RepID=UPI003A599611
MRRRSFLGGSALALGAVGAAGYWFGLRPLAVTQPAEVGFTLSAEEDAAARALMRQFPVIDAHAHPRPNLFARRRRTELSAASLPVYRRHL